MEKPTEEPQVRRLYRSEKDRILAGVCGGLGEYFEIDPTFIRIIFVVLTIITGGAALLLYLFCWLVIPTESQSDGVAGAKFEHTIHQGAEEFKHKAEAFAQEMRQEFQHSDHNERARAWWGALIIVLGLLLLLSNFGLFAWSLIGRLWPLILIFIGWRALTNTRR